MQKQLYEEVSSVLQPDELATPATLHKMPFLRGCIKETLRYGTIKIINMKTLFTPDKNNYALICTVLSSIFSFSPVGYTAGGNEPQIKMRVSPIEVLVTTGKFVKLLFNSILLFTLYWAFLIQFVGKVNENS